MSRNKASCAKPDKFEIIHRYLFVTKQIILEATHIKFEKDKDNKTLHLKTKHIKFEDICSFASSSFRLPSVSLVRLK